MRLTDDDKNYLSGIIKIYDATSHRKIQVDDLRLAIFCYYSKLSRQASVELIAERSFRNVWLDKFRLRKHYCGVSIWLCDHLLLAGRIIDRLGTKKGYTWAIIIWSIGAMIHASAIPIGEGLNLCWACLELLGLMFLLRVLWFARAVLAFGEAGNFPAAIKATAEYFPKKERSFATGIFNSGANIGAILAPLTVPWIEALGLGSCVYFSRC